MTRKTQQVSQVLHFTFTPKYRRAVLTGDVARRLDEITRSACDDLNIEIIALAIQPDHCHLLIDLPGTCAASNVAGRIKSQTSRLLRREFPHLVEQSPKALWGHRFYVRSVGGGRAAVKKYIQAQGF